MQTSSRSSLEIYLRLLQYLKPYWKVFLLSLLSMTIAALTEPFFARLMKPLIDGGFVNRDREAMVWVPLAIIGVFAVRGITTFINEYSSSWLTGHLVQTLREQMFAKMLRLRSEEHTSELQSQR